MIAISPWRADSAGRKPRWDGYATQTIIFLPGHPGNIHPVNGPLRGNIDPESLDQKHSGMTFIKCWDSFLADCRP